jgi:small subunit ribosomal protein S20
MPIIQSAKKKLRQDIKRTAQNSRTKRNLKETVKTAKKNPDTKTISEAYSEIDTAVKKKVIHKNKAARLKSQLVKRVNGKS